MGHRLEVYLSPEHAEEVIAISESFGIPAQIVGRVEACEQNPSAYEISPDPCPYIEKVV